MKPKVKKKKKQLDEDLLRKLAEQGDQLAQCYDEITLLIRGLSASQRKRAFDFVSFIILEKVYDIRE